MDTSKSYSPWSSSNACTTVEKCSGRCFAMLVRQTIIVMRLTLDMVEEAVN